MKPIFSDEETIDVFESTGTPGTKFDLRGRTRLAVAIVSAQTLGSPGEELTAVLEVSFDAVVWLRVQLGSKAPNLPSSTDGLPELPGDGDWNVVIKDDINEPSPAEGTGAYFPVWDSGGAVPIAAPMVRLLVGCTSVSPDQLTSPGTSVTYRLIAF